MKHFGNCAYPDCGEPVVLTDVQPRGKRPVVWAEGFVEMRDGGGAHGFAHGYERVGSKAWHWDCAKKHRVEKQAGGKQDALFG